MYKSFKTKRKKKKAFSKCYSLVLFSSEQNLLLCRGASQRKSRTQVPLKP